MCTSVPRSLTRGIIEGAAREAQEYRRRLRADVWIWADVGVKHASSLGNVSVEAEARDAVERGLADALIVTGPATGADTSPERLRAVRAAGGGCPVLVGSGLREETVAALLASADGAIVGTSLKRGGRIAGPIDVDRVEALMARVRSARAARASAPASQTDPSGV